MKLFQIFVCAGLVLFAGVQLHAASTPARPSKKTFLETMAEKTFPAEKAARAEALFKPIVRRYEPVLRKFNADYLASSNKLAVVERYLPRAEAALADARKMQVGPRVEKEKAEYIRMAEALLGTVRLTIQLDKMRKAY